ncbi:MAG: 30S ribosomal protein S16 [Candidatus Woesebacteria bacterium]|jgi:small subunit ribosomal protein S16
MLKIKLARFGKRKQPMYRIVVNEAKSKRDGKYVACLGHYAPVQNPKVLEVDFKAVDDWIAKGAKPTDTVAALIKKAKSKNPFPAKKKKLSKKAKAKLAAEKKAKEEAKKPKAEQAVAPEAKAEETKPAVLDQEKDQEKKEPAAQVEKTEKSKK